MTPYAGSEDDYNIHFQGTMLWYIGILSEVGLLKSLPKVTYFKVSCPECLYILPEGKIENIGILPSNIKPIYNPLFFAEEESIARGDLMWFYSNSSRWTTTSTRTPALTGYAIGYQLVDSTSSVVRSIVHEKRGLVIPGRDVDLRVPDLTSPMPLLYTIHPLYLTCSQTLTTAFLTSGSKICYHIVGHRQHITSHREYQPYRRLRPCSLSTIPGYRLSSRTEWIFLRPCGVLTFFNALHRHQSWIR
jgi:hypothetical protein